MLQLDFRCYHDTGPFRHAVNQVAIKSDHRSAALTGNAAYPVNFGFWRPAAKRKRANAQNANNYILPR